MSDKEDPSNPKELKQIEWGRRPGQVFRVGPIIGGARLYSDPQKQAGVPPAQPHRTEAPLSRPQSSVLSGSLVPQRRPVPKAVEPEPLPEITLPMAALEPAPLVPDEVQAYAEDRPVNVQEKPKSSRAPLWIGAGVLVLGAVALGIYLTRTPEGMPEPVSESVPEPVPVPNPVAEAPAPLPADPDPVAPKAVTPEAPPLVPPPKASQEAPPAKAVRPPSQPAPESAPKPAPKPALAPEPTPSAPQVAEPVVVVPPPAARPVPTDPDAPVVTAPRYGDGADSAP